jgi:hypothetical protein
MIPNPIPNFSKTDSQSSDDDLLPILDLVLKNTGLVLLAIKRRLCEGGWIRVLPALKSIHYQHTMNI